MRDISEKMDKLCANTSGEEGREGRMDMRKVEMDMLGKEN